MAHNIFYKSECAKMGSTNVSFIILPIGHPREIYEYIDLSVHCLIIFNILNNYESKILGQEVWQKKIQFFYVARSTTKNSLNPLNYKSTPAMPTVSLIFMFNRSIH